jgi:hypothetical protein
LSKRKTDQQEILEVQAKMLKALLDGMDCYLYYDRLNDQIMLNTKSEFTLSEGVPIIEDE